MLSLAPGTWLVSRYADCEPLLRDRRMGKNLGSSRMAAEATGAAAAEDPSFLGVGLEGWDAKLFELLDPPGHTRLRSLVAGSFTPAVIATLRDAAARFTAELLDAAPDRFEIMEGLAAPLAARVIGDLLGIPREDRSRFQSSVARIARILEPGAAPPPEQAARCREALAECTTYFVHLLEMRTGHGDDLISRLARSRELDDEFTRHQLAAICVLLVVPGLDTFAGIVGNTVELCARRPGLLPALAAAPDSADALVDEVVRLASPTQASWRVALEPVELHGVTIEAGDVVLLLLGSANRDERVFEDPDSVRLDRPARRHLAFGRGIHYCVGDVLSRMMLTEVLLAMAGRFTGVALAGDPVPKPSLWSHAFARLPVALTRRTG
ncbi:cytochrome P450 [Streptomyces pactum]|uniref:Cytochrome P450 n=1 Tax=Streptomyces pactum TaxID=68249 RepID=A0ABS0NGY8_9ACTN|nr:cytochrome P450 [Streptomyces pactum]MBH5334450.1 cytochrome P450 [Streptomyces pactum]